MLVPQTTFVASEDGLSIEPVQDRNKVNQCSPYNMLTTVKN
jgi:hypothetical protein